MPITYFYAFYKILNIVRDGFPFPFPTDPDDGVTFVMVRFILLGSGRYD